MTSSKSECPLCSRRDDGVIYIARCAHFNGLSLLLFHYDLYNEPSEAEWSVEGPISDYHRDECDCFGPDANPATHNEMEFAVEDLPLAEAEFQRRERLLLNC